MKPPASNLGAWPAGGWSVWSLHLTVLLARTSTKPCVVFRLITLKTILQLQPYLSCIFRFSQRSPSYSTKEVLYCTPCTSLDDHPTQCRMTTKRFQRGKQKKRTNDGNQTVLANNNLLSFLLTKIVQVDATSTRRTTKEESN